MKMQYGFNDKVPIGKAIPWALQYVFTIFTGSMTGSIMLANGAGLDSSDTAFLIQCGLFACCITTLIQSLGITIGKFQIGAKLPLVSAGTWTLITPLMLFANDPHIGKAGAFGAACLGTVLLFFLGPVVIDKLYKYFTPAVTGSVVVAVGMCLILNAWKNLVNGNPASPDAMKQFLIGISIIVICVMTDHFAKGTAKSLAVLIAMVGGYVFCAVTGMVDFSQVGTASWISVPKPLYFGFYVDIGAVITVFIIHIATIMQDSGNITSVVTTADEGLPTRETLKASVRGDALGGIISSLFNALPMCVAAQNSGVEAISGVASRYVTAIAGVIFGIMAIFPKFSQILALVPNPVLGGILIVTFGNIIAGGIKVIGFDKNNKRNFTIVGMATAVGIGGNFAQAAGVLEFLPSTVITLFTGISGTAITALILNIILPHEKKENA